MTETMRALGGPRPSLGERIADIMQPEVVPPTLEPSVRYLSEEEIALATAGLNPTSFSAGGILEMADQRLQDVDAQVLQAFATLNERNAASGAITLDMQHLQELQTALSSADKQGGDRISLADLEVTTPGGTMNAVAFIRKYELTEVLGIEDLEGSSSISANQVSSGIDALRQKQTQLNGRTEMDMIALQQLVQQRGQIITMATKLLDAMHESQKTILANLGR